MVLGKRMKQWGVMMVIIGLVVALPSHVYAQVEENEGTESTANMETTDANGNRVSCATIALENGATAKGVLMGKVVPCVIFSIQQASINFTKQMVDLLSPLLFAFLTFVLVMFGVRVASNEPEIYKQGLILIIKIAIVGIVLSDLGNYQSYDGSGSNGKLIPAVYQVMDASQSIVSGAIDPNDSSFKCEVSGYEAGGSPKIWAVLDCIGGKIFGFQPGGGTNGGGSRTGNGKMVLMTSLAGMLAGMFVSGPWGVAIMLGMIGVIVSILSIMVRTASAFINSYLIICLLIMISPLLLPLIFLKETSKYYEPVIKNLLASFLTPILFTAFTMFALIIYDKMLFADNSLLQNIMSYDKIKEALENPTQPCSLVVTGNPTAVRSGKASPTDSDISSSLSNVFMQSIMSPTTTGSNDGCAMFKIPQIDLSKVDDPIFQDEDKKKALNKLFLELVELVILSYLVTMAMAQLPTLIIRLAAGGSAVFYAINEGQDSVNNRFMRASQAALKPYAGIWTRNEGMKAADSAGVQTKDSVETFYKIMTGRDKE